MDRSADIARIALQLFPESEVVSVASLAPDAEAGGATEKAIGYGEPARVKLRGTDGERSIVFHTEASNPFGHDRRSDRARDMLLAYDTFGAIPRHARALDVGALLADGGSVSLRGADELYLVTEWAEGEVYAHALRRVAASGRATDEDVKRVEQIVDYLVALHAEKRDVPGAYRRSIRDLVGSGEGIYGLVDGYPEDVPGASRSRLEGIEARAAAWRWRLRDRDARLSRIHGDFHPFNLLLQPDGIGTLDASRGCLGDPADDLTCIAINFVFFALEAPASWDRGLGVLWRTLFQRYLAHSRDEDVLAVAPPFFAWRALVVANPRFYPAIEEKTRDRILGLAERTLDEGLLSPWEADELFA
jgi:hypothetical protein